MVMGLIIIGIIAVLLLFGVLRTVLTKAELSPLGLFVILIALTASVFIPQIRISGLTLNVATFVLPLILAVVFTVKTGKTSEQAFVFLSAIINSAVFLAVSLFMFKEGGVSDVVASILLGIITGAITFVLTVSSVGAISAVLWGFVLGQLWNGIVNFYANGSRFALGADDYFGSLMLAVALALLAINVFAMISRKKTEYRMKKVNYSVENAEEFSPKDDFYDDFFDR